MENRKTAHADFNQDRDEATVSGSKKLPSRAGWLAAMAAQALCGFFVAKIPVRPELAPVSAAFVVLFAWPCYHAIVRWLGPRNGVALLTLMGLFGLLVESAALVTGWPYGHFAYGEKIGALLFGIVPWTVPFAWTPLVCAAIAMARRWTPVPWKFVLLSGALLVAIDVVLDPAAVAQGFWRYETPGVFYGVPTQNFVGWLLTGSAAAWLMLGLAPRLRTEVPPVGFIGSSLLILSFWSSVCFWMALWLSAVVGLGLLAIFARVFFAGD